MENTTPVSSSGTIKKEEKTIAIFYRDHGCPDRVGVISIPIGMDINSDKFIDLIYAKKMIYIESYDEFKKQTINEYWTIEDGISGQEFEELGLEKKQVKQFFKEMEEFKDE